MKSHNCFDQQIPGIFMLYFLRTEVQIMFVTLYSKFISTTDELKNRPPNLSYVVRSLHYIALQGS